LVGTSSVNRHARGWAKAFLNTQQGELVPDEVAGGALKEAITRRLMLTNS
jgi:hypothetical protein